MLAKFAEAGAKNKESVNMLSTMGLYNKDKVLNDSSTTQVNTAAGGLYRADYLLTSPFKWINEVFAPAAMKLIMDNPKVFGKGMDLSDPKNMDTAIQGLIIHLTSTMGGQNLGQAFAVASLPDPASVSRSVPEIAS